MDEMKDLRYIEAEHTVALIQIQMLKERKSTIFFGGEITSVTQSLLSELGFKCMGNSITYEK